MRPSIACCIEKEIATGVVLEGGEEIRAGNRPFQRRSATTLLKLVQPGNLDTEFMKRIRHLRMNGCVAKVHLALDGLPDSWKPRTGRLVVAPKIDYVERAFDCAKYGRVADKPALEIVIPTLTDPAWRRPASTSLRSCPNTRPTSCVRRQPDQARAAGARTHLDTLDVLAPGLRTRVAGSEVADAARSRIAVRPRRRPMASGRGDAGPDVLAAPRRPAISNTAADPGPLALRRRRPSRRQCHGCGRRQSPGAAAEALRHARARLEPVMTHVRASETLPAQDAVP